MKNLILRANILDKNVDIQHRVLPLPLKTNVVELIISPKTGYILSTSNLSHGLLPSQIDEITFLQSGTRVIARVTISQNINNKVSHNVSLPIMSQSVLNIDSFKLTDRGFKTNKGVVSSSLSSFPKTTGINSETYNISSTPGETTLVLSKNLRAVGNYYFQKNPNYSITGNNNRYTIREESFTDSKNRLIGKKFNVYYTSPLGLDQTDNEDFIDFNVNITTKQYGRKKRAATAKEEYEIYSFSEGRKIGAEGGIKTMIVRGVPGTEFKIILQDGDKKTYNFDTGVFEAGGGMFLGTIPPARIGTGYGESLVYARIPRSPNNSTIKTIFTTDKPIDHLAIQQAVESTRDDSIVVPPASSANPVIATVTSPTTVSVDEDVKSYTTLNWSFGNGGAFTLDKLTYDPLDTRRSEEAILEKGAVITTKAKQGASTSPINFTAVVSATASDSNLEIERQPLFDKLGSFVNWDSGANKENALTSTGAVIPNDWYMSTADIESRARYTIAVKARGIGKAVDVSGATTYPQVEISGYISGITHGSKDIESKLDLLNFLTIHAL